MRKIVMIAGLAALAACSKPAEEPAAAPAEATSAAAAAASPAGTYTVTNADKTTGTLVIAADNSYTFAVGDTTAKGVVTPKDDKVACYDPEGDKDPTVCWTNEPPAADGSWTAKSDDGQTVSVVRQPA